MKIMTIVGTRPEAIKMAPVIQELSRRSGLQDFESIVCTTGQHREMVDQVLALFNIIPDIDLDLMQKGQTLSQVAARVLTSLTPFLESERPDWILVQGDTTTVMAASIAAYHLQIRVGHVEAGLRTGDRYSPFPEEINRIIAGHISEMSFAPTEQACKNLSKEGVAEDRIILTGNTIVDALQWVAAQPFDLSKIKVDFSNRETILVTSHRRENFGQPIRQICTAVKKLANARSDIQFVFPVHPNPNVSEPVFELLDNIPNVHLVAPLNYLELIHLMKQCHLILTDSGGIQEEAPSFGVPVLVLRENTERPEAVQAGAAKLVGTNEEKIMREVELLLNDKIAYASMTQSVNPYGDGKASRRIVDALLS